MELTGFDIGMRHVGDGEPCLIVAEVAQAHDGSLGQAHAYIDAVAQAGADAVKFQCHLADAESWPGEPWRVEPRWPQDDSRMAYWRRMEFTSDQWWSLAAHAGERGLIFLASPFSVEAVKLLTPLVPAWKVASGEVTNRPLLGAMTATRKPLLLSTGMATQEELRGLRDSLQGHSVAWLQCTSEYPTPPERVGLRYVTSARALHGVTVGLSDHSGTIWPSLGAVALGASIVEVHVTFSRQSFGFDVDSSITVEELAQLVEGARFIHKALTPLDKDEVARELAPMRELFMQKHLRRTK